MSLKLRTFFLFAILGLAMGGSLRAQVTLQWTGGTGNWDTTTANWTNVNDATVQAWPSDANDRWAMFTTASTTVTLTENVTANGVSFTRNGVVLDGTGSLLLATDSGGNTPYIAVQSSSQTAVISANLAGSSDWTKLGSGRLTLSGNNTFTGNLLVSGGKLRATTQATALGAGSLTLTNGATVELANDTGLVFGRDLTVTTFSGTIVSDRLTAGVGVTHTLGALTLGTAGTGAVELDLVKGSSVTSGTARVAFGAATMNVDTKFDLGAGTQLTLGSLTTNGYGTTFQGAGDAVITGSLQSTTTAGAFGKTGAGTLTLQGASNLLNSLSINQGLLAVQGGTVTGDHLDIFQGGSILLNGSTARWSMDGDLAVGNFAVAASATSLFTVSGGAALTANHITLGASGGDRGSILVTGAGSSLRDTSDGYNFGLTVGGGGIGNLTISDGATVTSTSGAVGREGTGTGTVLLTGAGSSWTTTGEFYLGYVGDSSGSLTVAAGATGSSQGVLYLGYQDNAQGALTVTGAGSKWTTANTFNVSRGDISLLDGGTLQVGPAGQGLAFLASGMTLHVGNGGLAGTLLAGGLNFDGAATFNFTDTATLGMTLQGNGSLMKLGAGTLILTGAADYGGTTTINGGTLQIGNGGTTGALTDYGNGMVNNGTLVFNRSDAVSYAGAISGTGALVKNGAGTLSLSGAGSYTGATTVNAGTLKLDFASTAGSGAPQTNIIGSGSTVTLNTATLNLTGKSNTANSQTLNGVTIGSGLNTITLTKGSGSGSITAALGALTRPGKGILNFSTAPSTTGTIATTSTANTNGILGPWATVGSTTTLQYATVNGSNQIVSYAGATAGGTNLASVTSASTNYTYSAAATLAGSLTGNTLRYSGAATITNLGANSLTLNGLMNAGTGALTISGTAGSAGLVIGSSGELDIFNNAQTTAISSVISGTGFVSFAAIGAGTLTLSGANTFDGGFVLNSGTLNLNNNAALGSGTFTFNAGTLNATVAGVTLNNNLQNWNSNFTFTGTQSLNLGTGAVTLSGNRIITTTANTLTVGGAIGDGGNGYSLTKAGSGTLTLTGVNTYGGGTTVSAGTLQLGGSATLGSGTAALTLGGGTLNLGGTSQTAGAVTMTSGTLSNGTLTGASYDFRSGTISANLAGSAGLTKSTTGTLTLSGTNTYSGNTLVTGGGTLVLGSSGALPATSNVQLNGSILGLGAGAPTTLSLGTGAGQVQITGDAGFAAVGVANSLTLNSGAGLTWGAGGFVPTGNSLLLGSASTNFALNFTNAINLGSATRSITLGTGLSSVAKAATLSGVLSGTGALQITGSGSIPFLALTGVNTYSGGTIINDGVSLIVGNNSALGTGQVTFGGAMSSLQTSGAAVTLANDIYLAAVSGGSFEFLGDGAGPTLTLNGAIHADDLTGFDKMGTGTLVLNGANTMNGDASLYAGTTIIGNDAAFGVGALYMKGGALQGDGTARTIANQFSFNQSFTIGGSSDLTFTGAVFYNDLVNDTITISNTGVTTFSGQARLAINVARTTTLAVGTGASLVFSGEVANGYSGGVSSIIKSGAGTLTLSGVNTYTGKTTLNAGALSIRADSGLGTAPNSATAAQLTFGGGTLATTATFTLNANRGVTLNTGGGTFDTAADTTLGYSGIIAGAAGLTKANSGTLSLGGVNTYTGVTTLTGGILSVGSLAAGGANSNIGKSTNAAANLVLNGGTLRYNGAAQSTDRLFTLGANGGTLDASGTGALSFTNTGSLSASGAGTLTLTGSNTGANTLASVIVNPGAGTTAVSKTGAGAWTLSGANTYAGGTVVNGGTLSVSADANLGNAAGAVALGGGTLATTADFVATRATVLNAGGGTFNVATGTTLTWNGAITGGIGNSLTKLGTGTLVLGGTNSYFGDTTISFGTLKLGSATALSANTNLVVASGAAFDANGFTPLLNRITGAGTLNVGGAGVSLQSAASSTFDGTLSGAGSLSVGGGGAVTLTGNSAGYTGATNVTGGTLRVNGSMAGSAVTIGSGGFLGGSGSVGALTIGNGGTLAPGNSPGTLFAGNTVWSGGGSYQWQVNNATGSAGIGYDLLNITGTLDLRQLSSGSHFTLLLQSLTAGNLSGDVINFNAANSYTYTIASASGGILGFNAANFTINSAGFTNPNAQNWSVTQNGNSLNLVYSAIPEPSTYAALAGVGVLALALWRRRRGTRLVTP